MCSLAGFITHVKKIKLILKIKIIPIIILLMDLQRKVPQTLANSLPSEY